MYIFLLIFLVIYFIWTIFIFKKKDLMYSFFWLFLSTIFFMLMFLLLMGNSFSQEDKYIEKVKEKYIDSIDLPKTKIYINDIYDSDVNVKDFLKNFRKQTRFTGNSYGIENIRIKIVDEKGKTNEIIFYLKKERDLCKLYLKKPNNNFIYLGVEENYCDTLAEKYLDKK